MLSKNFIWAIGLLGAIGSALANIPGGGTGTGPDVTITDGGSTVTMANGIVSIVCSKSGAKITSINYTYNNGGGTQTIDLLAGGHNGGELYWELGWGSGSFTMTGTVDTGDYGEIILLTTSSSSGEVEIHFSMLRGSTGFYVTPIWRHRSQDGAIGLGETRDNIYAGSIFNWMSVDATRNKLMPVSGGSAVGVAGAPVEVSLWVSGIYAGQYEDKYKYGADFGEQRVWGWSSVGAGGKNVGLWNVLASAEFYNGGPMKRELMSHMGTTILNMLNGGHYGSLGQDSDWAAGEVWTKVYGPYFIYCNDISNTISDTNSAAQMLYSDALAQAAAEATAWPYSWFNDADYAPAADRGVVKGQMVINDSYNPNASASNLWVGLVQQPSTVNNIYDFQLWVKPYQFWVKTDADGHFTLPAVIAGGNYTLYAFGPGAAGTFQSQAQSGGSTPNSIDIPAAPFSVAVTGGATNDLGTVAWTPTRVAPTVFEIGYPDRTGRKFKHGDDWWVGDIGPDPSAPSPVWSKWLEYAFDYPSGPNYVVGQSRWTTDWNFVQPVFYDTDGVLHSSTSTLTFDLDSAPTGTASFYIALSSDYQGPLIIQVNGTDIAGSVGYFPNYSGSAYGSSVTIREGIHGIFSDNRINFNANLLHSGQNTITIRMRKGDYFANHAMYDYIRLEVPNYIPPAPASVSAYAGNNCNLVCWPVVAGATSYNILRSTTSGSGYVSVTNGVTGPVCGSGWNNATWLDTTAVNGTPYYYVVQSVNPIGNSANSSQSPGATPDGGISTNAPATPVGVTIGSSGHQSVTLNWGAVSGANFYTIYRSTLFDNGGGASNVLGTVVLANNLTSATYTDNSPTDGSIYSYCVTATSAGGTSGCSPPAVALPKPAPPASAPGGLAQTDATSSSIALDWSPVSDAVGYVISRGTSPSGPFTLLQSTFWTGYTDSGLNAGEEYYYQVAAMNAGGVANATLAAFTIGAPVALTAIPGNGQVEVGWNALPGVTSYTVWRSTTDGGPYSMVGATTNTSYPDTGLVNETTYYYVVYANTPFGTSPQSEQVSAKPSAAVQIAATATMPGTTLDNATGPTLVTSGTFNLNGGNAVVLVFTAEQGALDVITATFAGQTMSLGTSASQSAQWAYIFYLINPAATSGQFVITTTGTGADCAYSAIALANVGSVAGSDKYSSTSSTQSEIIPLDYTTHTGGGFVLGAAVNNAYNTSSAAPPIFVSGNANQTLLPSTLLDTSGHLQTYGTVATSGAHTDNYSHPVQRNAYVTLAFDAGLAVPANLMATAGDSQVPLSWDAVPNATGYNVKRAFVSGGPYTTIATGLTGLAYTNTGLANGTLYYYVVSASNSVSVLESPNSAQVSASPAFATPPNIAERIYALTTENQLISFESTDPGAILTAYTVSGLQANEKIVGIDFWNGILYGLGDQNHLYTLNVANGAAGLVGSFTPVLNGEAFGFEAEPGGLRLVSNLDQDLLLNYSTAVATVGPTINGSPNPAITGLAYHPGNGQMYAADYYQNTIGLLNTGSGLVSTIGQAGIDFSRHNGFDISSNPGTTAYLASPAASSGLAANLYTVDLTTGSASFVGLIGLDGDNTLIRGLAVRAGYVNLNPTDLSMSASGDQLTLSWPEDHIGWQLQVQTNTLATGLSTNWVEVPGSTSTNSANITIDPTQPAVFYRLKY